MKSMNECVAEYNPECVILCRRERAEHLQTIFTEIWPKECHAAENDKLIQNLICFSLDIRNSGSVQIRFAGTGKVV